MEIHRLRILSISCDTPHLEDMELRFICSELSSYIRLFDMEFGVVLEYLQLKKRFMLAVAASESLASASRSFPQTLSHLNDFGVVSEASPAIDRAL